MWDDFKVGKGDKGTMAYGIKDIEGVLAAISESGNAYWLSDCICGTSGIVFKKTKEGLALSDLLKSGSHIKINNFLDRTVLDNISSGRLRSLIRKSNHASFAKGQESARQEVRAVLGVT